jgi:hypothetical protein
VYEKMLEEIREGDKERKLFYLQVCGKLKSN